MIDGWETMLLRLLETNGLVHMQLRMLLVHLLVAAAADCSMRLVLQFSASSLVLMCLRCFDREYPVCHPMLPCSCLLPPACFPEVVTE